MPIKFLSQEHNERELWVSYERKFIDISINDSDVENDNSYMFILLNVEEAKLLIKEIEKNIKLIEGGNNG